MNEIQRLFSFLICCRSRQKRIDHLTFGDPMTFFIYTGINAMNISRSTPLIIADFGSSYGRNSIQIMKIILEYLEKTNKLRGIPLIIHNDLPTNDWTRFFRYLVDDNSYQGLANGRSFYEPCLPINSISIAFSSASLHYLSQKPCNISNHYYFHFADEDERERFQYQSKHDFNLFIEHRSLELRSGGILILNIPSTNKKGDMGFNYYFNLIYKCIQLLSLLTEQELVDFTLPFYLRTLSECIDLDLFNRCLLKLIKVELICSKAIIFDQYQNGQITRNDFAKNLTILMRPGTELALKEALQINGRLNEEIDNISNQFWTLYEQKVRDELYFGDVNTYTTYLILKKK